jgi:hypothetical protein
LFVDPYLKIYAGRPNREIGQPLALEHPSAFSHETSRITYTNHPAYSLDEAVGVCDANGRLTRVLRPPHELDSVEVELVNLGSVATKVCLSQGLFQGESIGLLPGQTWRKRLDPMNCPAPVERVYPFSLQCDPPQPVLMRLVSDPLLMGLRALERGQWELAQETLEPAQAEKPQALIPAGLLAAALSQTGQAQAAAGLLEGRDKDLESLAALAGSGLSATEWPKRLEEFSGYYPDLLFNALKRRYPLPVYDLPDWHWRRSRRGSGPSCSVLVSSLPEDQGVGSLAEVRPHDFFPDLPLTAKVRLTWLGSFGPEAKPVAELRALRRGPAGDLKLKPRPIRAEELGDSGQAEFSLDLPGGDHEGRWEIGLACFGDHRIRISELSIQVDPRATLARQARWVLLAWGRTLAQRGDQAGAARVWEILGRVSPGFAPALTEQIKAMSAVGRNQALTDLLGESLPELQGRPDLLARAAHALEGMGRAELAGEYRRQLAKLQPDTPLGVSFANGVNLAGYSLSGRQVKPGGELNLRLYWSFPKALDFDWAIFTHLDRPGGQVNFDHHLDQGRLRMDKLRPGEMVVDNVPLQFDAKTQPGQYTVKVGLYWGGLGRVAVTSGSPEGDDSADLGKITVLPADKP